MDKNLNGKMPLFQICIVNGDNRVLLDIPYGNLENMCRSLLCHGNKIEIIGFVLKSIGEL